jgi:hypothetical protein
MPILIGREGKSLTLVKFGKGFMPLLQWEIGAWLLTAFLIGFASTWIIFGRRKS